MIVKALNREIVDYLGLVLGLNGEFVDCLGLGGKSGRCGPRLLVTMINFKGKLEDRASQKYSTFTTRCFRRSIRLITTILPYDGPITRSSLTSPNAIWRAKTTVDGFDGLVVVASSRSHTDWPGVAVM